MMQKHPKLLIIGGIICLILIVGLLWSGHQESPKSSTQNNPIKQPAIIKDKVSGDTENEVLKTVLANQETLKTQNKKLQDENEELRKKGIKDVSQVITKIKEELESEIGKVRSDVDTRAKSQDYTINAGSGWQGSSDAGQAQVITSAPDLSQDNVATDSISSKKIENDNSHLSSSNFNSNDDSNDKPPTLPSDTDEKSEGPFNPNNPNDATNTITPFYTIPAGSTLNHVKLMTALIAEVPVSGRLVAPAFPFKAIIGKKQLYAANGLTLPDDLRGTIIQGYSVGSMSMSCARVYVNRILFVFNDGHYEVYPDKDDQNDATSVYPKNALGYLSDSYGNTCLVGKYITDAPKVLANLAILGGISTGANAVATAQFSTMNNGQAFTSAMTGNMGKLVGASAVNGASQEILQWYKERVGDVFDAVFIPASFNHRPTDLALHISKTIPIDLDKKGRTLRYENKNTLSSYFNKLD